MFRKAFTTSLVTLSLSSASCSLMVDFEKSESDAGGADAGGHSNKGGAGGAKSSNAGSANLSGGAANTPGGTAATSALNGGTAGSETAATLNGGMAGTPSTETTPGGMPGTSSAGTTGLGGATTGAGGSSGTGTVVVLVGGATAQGGVGQGGSQAGAGGSGVAGVGAATQGGAAGNGGTSTATGGMPPSTGGVATGGMPATGGTSSVANPCSPNPCAHGTCKTSGDSYACTCSLNYFGPTCTGVRLEAISLPSADAVDTDGNVVVGRSFQAGSSNTYAAQWTPSGGLQFLSSDSASGATAVSGDGLTVFGLGGIDTLIYRWSGGTQFPMGLPVTTGSSALYAQVNATNSDGTVMVGSARNPAGYNQAFRWSSGGGFDVFGPRDSFATGVSGDGTKVVGSASVANLSVPYSWSVATRAFTNLSLPSGYPDCYANNISSDGRVTVGFCNGTGQLPRAAVRWVNSSVYNLGFLVSTDNSNIANGCNSDGSVVLGNSSDSWIWDGLNGMRSLTSILTAANADMSQWTFFRGNAISADGKTVVGHGTYAGSSTAFIARLP